MRRAVILSATALLLAIPAWWWRSHAAPAEPSPPEADEQARARLERLRAQLAAASSAPLPPPKGDLEIAGRVVGRHGPVAGATVIATSPDPGESLPDLPCDPESRRELLDSDCEDATQLASLVADRRGDAQPMARATTDGAGSFTLRGLAAGTYALWAEAPEGAGMKERVAAGSSADVLLGEGMRIRGKVVDAQGRPLEAAVVTAIFPNPSRFSDALSAADGSFSIGPLPVGEYTVVAQSGTLHPARATVSEGSRESCLLALRPSRRVRGRVLLDGAPVPGASVMWYRDPPRAQKIVLADQAGDFVVDQLLAGEGVLTARSGSFQAEKRITVTERADPSSVELHLELGGRVECSVRGAAGTPVPKVKVTLRDGTWNIDIPVAADGTCHGEGVPPGDYDLDADAEGFDLRRTPSLHVFPGETATAELVLEPLATLEGTVVAMDGRPVAGAVVNLPSEPHSPARTGDDGRFSVKVPQTDSIDLEVSHDDYVATSVEVKLPDPHLVVRLTPGAGLDGVVLDAAGSPVERALVYACEDPVDAKDLDSFLSCPSLREDRADAVGAFHLRALPGGPVTLVAVRDTASSPGQWAVKALDRVTPDRVRLQFPPAGRIAGLAVDEAGHPLQGVRVEVSTTRDQRGEPEILAQRSSDETGAFETPPLDVGGYQLAGELSGYEPAHAIARTGDQAVKLVLHQSPSPKIRGRVLTSRGEPVPLFRVSGTTVEEPSGRFAIDRPADGLLVAIRVRDALAPTIRSVPPGNDDYELGDVVVTAGRRVAGRVLDAQTGRGISGAGVEATPYPGYTLRSSTIWPDEDSVRTRPDGSFELPRVPDDVKDLFVWRDGYGRQVIRLHGEPEVQVRLQRPGRLTGEARWAGTGSLRVLATGIDLGDSGSADADASGHFAIDDLEPGTYSVSVVGNEVKSAFYPVKVEVEPDREAHVSLVAQSTGGWLHANVSGLRWDETLVGFLVPSLAKLPDSYQELAAVTRESYRAVGSASNTTPKDDLFFKRVPSGQYGVLIMLASPKPTRYRLAMVPVVVGEEDQSIDIAVPAGAPAIDRPADKE